jgi:hypothetical protein
VKNRMRETRTSGSVRGGDSNVLTYSARRFRDRTRSSLAIVEAVEPGIGIGLQDPGVVLEVTARMLAAAVSRVVEQRRRRCRAGERPVVADVGPKPAGDGLALGQDRHRGVVPMDARTGQDVRPDQRDQGRQGSRAGANPTAEGGDVQAAVLTGVGLALPVERQVLTKLWPPGSSPAARAIA